MMKNLFFAFLALYAFTLFSGCNKDDDDMGSDVKNEFTYDGTTYSLSKGFYSDLGSNGNGTYDLDIFLTTAGVSQGGFSGLTGTGDGIYLDLNTTTATGVVAGTYNWSNSRENFTIVPGSSILLDYNYETFTGTSISFTDGTVEIAVGGTGATITFSATTTDGKTVSGEWKGLPENI
jgi:hypothetical protein